jgi:hypothetical protein
VRTDMSASEKVEESEVRNKRGKWGELRWGLSTAGCSSQVTRLLDD